MCIEGWLGRVSPLILIAKWASPWNWSEATMRLYERDSVAEKLTSREEVERGFKEWRTDELDSVLD